MEIQFHELYFALNSIAGAFAIGVAALGGTIGVAIATRALLESIARQPEMEGKLRTWFIVGFAVIESIVLYAFIVTLMLITKK